QGADVMNPISRPGHRAWTSVMLAAGANATGMLVALQLDRSVPGVPWWPAAASCAFGFVSLAVLWVLRARATARLTSAIYMANVAVIVTAFYLANGQFAHLGVRWV